MRSWNVRPSLSALPGSAVVNSGLVNLMSLLHAGAGGGGRCGGHAPTGMRGPLLCLRCPETLRKKHLISFCALGAKIPGKLHGPWRMMGLNENTMPPRQSTPIAESQSVGNLRDLPVNWRKSTTGDGNATHNNANCVRVQCHAECAKTSLEDAAVRLLISSEACLAL